MITAERDFDSIVRQAEREFMGSPQRRQPDLPFFHYTNARGFEGIISKGLIFDHASTGKKSSGEA